MEKSTAYLAEDLREELATLQLASDVVGETATKAINELTTLQAAYDKLHKQFVQVNNQLTAAQSFNGELKDMVNYLERRLKGDEVVS